MFFLKTSFVFLAIFLICWLSNLSTLSFVEENWKIEGPDSFELLPVSAGVALVITGLIFFGFLICKGIGLLIG